MSLVPNPSMWESNPVIQACGRGQSSSSSILERAICHSQLAT